MVTYEISYSMSLMIFFEMLMMGARRGNYLDTLEKRVWIVAIVFYLDIAEAEEKYFSTSSSSASNIYCSAELLG